MLEGIVCLRPHVRCNPHKTQTVRFLAKRGLENKSSVHSLHYDATGNVRDIQVAVASNKVLAIPCLSHLSNAPRERTGRESMHSITSSAASHRDSETRKIICWTNGIKFSGGERLL